MPWSNQSGGGGPWQPRNPGPWGSGPSGGSTPPDLEDLIRRGQDRLKGFLPGGGLGGRGIAIVVLLALVGWGLSGFYRVQPNEKGVVLRFGAYHRTTENGFHYHLPYPIESVLTPDVTQARSVPVGLRIAEDRARTIGAREVPQESLMLTGDENIVDVNFTVIWIIKDAPAFLFNIQNPEGTIKAVAESAMREVVGRSEVEPILTQARQTTEVTVQEMMQKALDEYGAGVQITQVQLQKVDPPAQVVDAFRDVQAAQADRQRLQNEAQAYANSVVPEARGDAARIIQAAEAYRERVVAEATGSASRFTKIYEEYRKAPEVTRQRMYLETMERVYDGMDKIIIDDKAAGNGIVPYLPLDEMNRRPGPAAATGGASK